MTYISFVLSTLTIREGEDMTREGDPEDFMEKIKHQLPVMLVLLLLELSKKLLNHVFHQQLYLALVTLSF